MSDPAPVRVAVRDASNAPGGDVVWAINDEDLDLLEEAIRASHLVVPDLETTGLCEFAWTGGHLNGGVAARVVLASFTLPTGDEDGEWDGQEPVTWILPLSHPDSPFRGTWRATLRRVMGVVLEAQKPLSNANLKFDARWVDATTQVALEALIVWDTQVSSHLLDETRSTRLKDRAPETFGIPPWDDHDLTYPGAAEDVPLYDLGEYAARDTYWTWRLTIDHRERMFLTREAREVGPSSREESQEARLGTVATWVAMPMVASLTRIERNGFMLDVPWVREKLADDEGITRRGLDEMSAAYGMERKGASTAPTSHWFMEWAQRAVDAGDLNISGLTPTGRPSWGKGILVRQDRQGLDMATLLLETKRATKRAEFLRSWLGNVSKDGFIHSSYWPGRVVTGRLSSSDPNMQQVTKSLRPAFIARPGNVLVDLDYSQIELRVIAYVSRCVSMMQAYQDGKDLHRMLAAQFGNVTEDMVLADDRQKAKAGNFGLAYGMHALGLRDYAETNYGVSLTFEEAQDMYYAYFDLWEGLSDWHARVVTAVHRDGFIVSPIGRVRRLPGIFSPNGKMVSFAERAAINSPIQGFASDLMQMSAASIQGYLPGTVAVPNTRLVGTVHDSIVAEVPEGDWEEPVALMQERMTTITKHLDRFGVDFDVPLVADATVGTRWSWHDVSDPDDK